MALYLTYEYIRAQYQAVLDEGYEVLRCRDYVARKGSLPARTLVNRVDIDFSLRKTRRLVDIFDALGIKATFFLRLHAREYNPFSFEGYSVVKQLLESGHELGYHSEVEDQAAIWGEDAAACLRRDLDVMKAMFGVDVVGVASHRGTTPWNNLDFWKDRTARDFGLLYEAYDTQPAFDLFRESFYVSDSEWTQWKCYAKGTLVSEDRRSLAEHARDHHAVLYALIHADTYYDRHCYEDEQ